MIKKIFCSGIFLPYNNWGDDLRAQSTMSKPIHLRTSSTVYFIFKLKKNPLNQLGKELYIGWYDGGLQAALLIKWMQCYYFINCPFKFVCTALSS